MGIFFGKNSKNQDIPYIEEDQNSTIYKPKDFNELLIKIEILCKYEKEKSFYREINIKN